MEGNVKNEGVVSKMKTLESFVWSHQNSLKSLFQRRRSSLADDESAASLRPIPQLSLLANSVVIRCAKVLKVCPEDLQHRFDIELTENVQKMFTYSRNLLEFCSCQALNQLTGRSGYLSDPDFRRLTYDMMLAWESPSIDSAPQNNESTFLSNQEGEEEEGGSLFYSSSTNMAVQVDDKKTVSREGFVKIAPLTAAVADIITAYNLFDALTSSSAQQLHFLIYDKYLRNLDKAVKSAKSAMGSSLSSLPLEEGEVVLDVDGMVPTQPVLQHTGMSAWPGRLTLTNFALYFESLGVGGDRYVRYDLALELKQVIKADLTGPLGARLFDKAVMYKSTALAEPVNFEFPEFKGNSRRDYWLEICLEILYVHRFIRKYTFKETQKSEALSRAILGILRYRAVREAFHFVPSQYKTLLSFNLAESLPRGDRILEALSGRMALLSDTTAPTGISPVFLLNLSRLGFMLKKDLDPGGEVVLVEDISVGGTNPLEIALKKSILDTESAEAAQATVEQVKVEGIDTNFAAMKALLSPAIMVANHLEHLASWKSPFKSILFSGVTCCAFLWGWTKLFLSLILLYVAILMLWRGHFNQGEPVEAFKITAPPNKNAVEQILILQESISQAEAVIQSANVVLLKIRALLLAILPQASEKVAIMLVTIAGVVAIVPSRYILVLVFLEVFTREMPYRKGSADRWRRRLREWWIRIPAAPVQLIRPDHDKKKKS